MVLDNSGEEEEEEEEEDSAAFIARGHFCATHLMV